jgi:hypothetical protein
MTDGNPSLLNSSPSRKAAIKMIGTIANISIFYPAKKFVPLGVYSTTVSCCL